MKVTARCDCGELELLVSSPPVVQLVCHCSDCQTFSGQKFVEAAFFRKESCQVKGQTRSETLDGGTGTAKVHHSCQTCGTPLFVRVGALNGAVAIMATRLAPFEFEAAAHIWTSHKAEGVTIADAMLQSPGRPPEEIVERMINGFWK